MSNRRSIFDAVRKMLGRGFTKAEVERLDAALDAAGVPESALKPAAPSPPENDDTPHTTGLQGVDLIKRFEGCHRPIGAGRFMAYPDPGTGGKPWTIGWGSTRDFDEKPIKPGTVWSQQQCDDKLVRDLRQFERDVRDALGGALAATSQAQFDALVSFHYNTGAIRRATLTRKHKAGDYRGAQREFGRWNKAGGRVLKGLTRRRASEAKLYASGS